MKSKCIICREEITGFKDKLSEKEYRISGMCQKCQDSVFDYAKKLEESEE